MTISKTRPKAKPKGRKDLSGSLEDYLEAILELSAQGQVARVRDIAKRLGVSMSSVTAALRALSKRRLVNYDPYEVITLTDRGRAAAQQVRQRHQVIRSFLTEVLHLDERRADANACRMEHGVDDVVLSRLSKFARFVQESQFWEQGVSEAFEKYCLETGDEKAGEPGGAAA
ncbi:MAG: metal-dependent transcriptional regulator [Phycisphaerae bacterium]|nr:metal-dependent transcriptional regulator [Phycisphaerae bacterium]